MKKYFFNVGIGLQGYDATGTFDASNSTQAEEFAREKSIENAEMYGFEQDEEAFSTLDEVGRNRMDDDDDDDEDYDEDNPYEEVGELTYEVELYVPELHDDLL